MYLDLHGNLVERKHEERGARILVMVAAALTALTVLTLVVGLFAG